VRESPEHCDLTPCDRQAVSTLRLVVDGDVVEVAACAPHADWMRSFAGEDPCVALVDTDGLAFEDDDEDEQLEA
jgi:hypothetical protein